MSKILGKNVPWTSAFALACLAFVGADVRASGSGTASSTHTETYSTSPLTITGSVKDSDGHQVTGPIGFTQITSGLFGLNSNVSLGSFTVSGGDSSATTYNNAHFSFTYNPVNINGISYGNQALTITGELNGTVDGNTSSVVATFDPIKKSVFQTPDSQYLSSLSLPTSPLLIVPSTTNMGNSTIEASVVTSSSVQPPPLGGGGGTPTPTPEPTTLVILATSLVGLGLRRRLRSGRQSA